MKLQISASNNYDTDFQTVPVNSLKPISIKSPIGDLEIYINIKNFIGSSKHEDNSLYNIEDAKIDDAQINKLEIVIIYYPNTSKEINGADFIFGNDFTFPIRDHLPTTLLSTGLKFFNWFIDSSVKGDVYNDKPFLYGIGLASFNYIEALNEDYEKLSVELNEKLNTEENEDSDTNNKENNQSAGKIEMIEKTIVKKIENLYKLNPQIPQKPAQRMKHFTNQQISKTYNFTQPHKLHFVTDNILLQDSVYKISMPTFRNKSVDIDMGKYVNGTLNKVNFVLKYGGWSGCGEGETGCVIKIEVVDY